MIIKDSYAFDDLLLVPKFSTVESRSHVDISVKIGSYTFKHPIIPANMKTIIGKEMAIEIVKSGGLAILHRFMSEDQQIEIFKQISAVYGNNNFALSVGVKDSDKKMAQRFYDEGGRIICIDIAHGESKACVEMIYAIKNISSDIFIIAGNVATGDGAEVLWNAGADAVKGSVGAGSLCSTRIETGNGVPSLTALIDIYERRAQKHYSSPKYIISDGGIKNAGDIVKSLCFADMVMCGNIFAGCDETPGKTMTVNGVSYKEYVGSSTHKTNHIEGVEALVHPKGSYSSILQKHLEGLKSGCSYQGAHNLTELKNNPTFIKISNAGLVESHPHDVIVIK